MDDMESGMAVTQSRFSMRQILQYPFKPIKVIKEVLTMPRRQWLPPMIIISLIAVASLIAAGWVKQQAAAMGEVTLPPDFEYYSPEQQAQYLQASQATQGFAFVYALPILGALSKIWLGWLLVGAILHLSITLLGGRGETSKSMTLVAWAFLPFALRDLVRLLYYIFARQPINSPGLSGLVTLPESNVALLLTAVLSLIDIYLLWHVVLLIRSVKATTGLPSGKAVASVLITTLVIAGLQTGAIFLINKLQSLSISQPFFF